MNKLHFYVVQYETNSRGFIPSFPGVSAISAVVGWAHAAAAARPLLHLAAALLFDALQCAPAMNGNSHSQIFLNASIFIKH